MSEEVSHNLDEKSVAEQPKASWRDRLPFVKRRQAQPAIDTNHGVPVIPPTDVDAPEWESPEQAIGEVLALFSQGIKKRNAYAARQREIQANTSRRGAVDSGPSPVKMKEELTEENTKVRDTLEKMRGQFGDMCATVGEGAEKAVVLRVGHQVDKSTQLVDPVISGGMQQEVVGTVTDTTVDYLLVNPGALSLISCRTARTFEPEEDSPVYTANPGRKEAFEKHAAKFSPDIAAVGSAAVSLIKNALRTGQASVGNIPMDRAGVVAGEKLQQIFTADIDSYMREDSGDESNMRLRNLRPGQQSFSSGSWEAGNGVQRRNITTEDLPEVKDILEKSIQSATTSTTASA